jgi:hypothetical protein
VLSMVEYGAALGASHTAASYARLVELAGLLEMPPPPPTEQLAVLRGGEEWARDAGLLHSPHTCRSDRDGHWAFACRG